MAVTPAGSSFAQAYNAARRATQERLRRSGIKPGEPSSEVLFSNEGLVWSADFETGTTPADLTAKGFFHSGNATSNIVTFAGKRCVKMDLDHITDTIPYRTELQPNNIPGPSFTAGHSAIIGQTYWYGMQCYMPLPAYASDTTSESIVQWHDISDPAEVTSGVARGSVVAIVLRPHDTTGIPRFTVIVRADSKATTPTTAGEAKYSDPAVIYDLGPVSDYVNRWLSLVWRIKWGFTDATGSLTLWCNGKTLLSLPAKANCFNDIEGPYFKFGIYKWPWEGNQTNTGVSHRTIYFDNIRIGTSAANYGTVAR